MYKIKRYANGRFYDTVEKNYVTRDQIAELMGAGKKVSIVDTKTDEDITKQVVSQIKAGQEQKPKSKKAAKKTAGKAEDTANIIVQLFRKGGDALSDYGKKYTAMWQNLMSLSREEIDKLVNMMVKEKQLTEKEGSKLRTEIERYRENAQKWMTRNVDQRINEMLTKMNLANRDQVVELTEKINELNNKIEQLEKTIKKRNAVKTPAPAKKPETTV